MNLLIKAFSLGCICFLYFGTVFAQSTESLTESIEVTAEVISNTVSPATPPPSPNPINNNGVPLTIEAGTDTAIFRGRSYPNSVITLLKNGLVLNQLPSNIDGTFEIPVRNIRPGTYTFGLRAEDSNKLSSSVLFYTIYITAGVVTEISDIIMPPTITSNNIEAQYGSQLIFSGSSIPYSNIVLTVFSKNGITKNIEVGEDGKWMYSFNTKEVSYGDYVAKARSYIDSLATLYSEPLLFTIGQSNKKRGSVKFLVNSRCDLNNDSRVNLLDFSIMAFWYKRLGFPSKVDLNSDSRISLTDLSILAYCWTG